MIEILFRLNWNTIHRLEEVTLSEGRTVTLSEGRTVTLSEIRTSWTGFYGIIWKLCSLGYQKWMNYLTKIMAISLFLCKQSIGPWFNE